MGTLEERAAVEKETVHVDGDDLEALTQSVFHAWDTTVEAPEAATYGNVQLPTLPPNQGMNWATLAQLGNTQRPSLNGMPTLNTTVKSMGASFAPMAPLPSLTIGNPNLQAPEVTTNYLNRTRFFL